jgi:ribosomal protein L37AE/L43A
VALSAGQAAVVHAGGGDWGTRAALLPSGGSARHNQRMGRKDKGREICINCGQTFHKKLTSKELRCTKCRKAEKKAA